MWGAAEGAGGGGGFARMRLSAAMDMAMRACASSSMRTANPDKNREPRYRGAATFSGRKRLGFGCRKREPLSVRDRAVRDRPCCVYVLRELLPAGGAARSRRRDVLRRHQ